MDLIVRDFEKPVFEGPEPALQEICLKHPMRMFGEMMNTADILHPEEMQKFPGQERVWVVERGLYSDAMRANGWKPRHTCDVGRSRCYLLMPEPWVKDTGEDATIIGKSYTWDSAARLLHYCRVKCFTWDGSQWATHYKWQLHKWGTALVFANMPGTKWVRDGMERFGPEVVLTLIDETGVLEFPVLSVHYKDETDVVVEQGLGGRGLTVSKQDYLRHTSGVVLTVVAGE
jgi:hypothetical protein